MKRRLIISGWLVLVCGLLLWVASALAQQKQTPAATSSGKLEQVISFVNNGNPQAARKIITTINNTDPDYETAMCYDAMCQYALGNQKAFLKAMESPAVQRANVAPDFKESLDLKQIDVLFTTRKFEQLFPKIEGFQSRHVQSTNLSAVVEYQMAGLFERGMKQAYESGVLNTNESNQRWDAGKKDLQQFLSLTASFTKTNYQVLSKRVLKENVWVARMTLGDEKRVLNEIPDVATDDQERARLLGIQLYQKLQPHEVDQNLQRMGSFVSDFPQSKNCKRVEFDMANISFSRGEALIKEAEQAGDANTAASKLEQAHVYFGYTRILQKSLVVDPASGIEASDVFDREDDLLHSYYLEKDYLQMSSFASGLVKKSTPGDVEWMMAKLYVALGLLQQTPPDLKQGASELDDVIALGFSSHRDHNAQLVAAVKWRIYIAQLTGDSAKAVQLVQWVQGSEFTKNQKAAFLKDYSALAVSQKTSPK